MKSKQFRIDIFGLKHGSHDFEFEFDEQLFKKHEDSIVESGKGICKIELVKKDRLIEVNFHITGHLDMICDRSAEEFDYQIDIEEQLILKYGEKYDDSHDEIWTIPNSQQDIHFEKNLYDYLTLAVPMKKLHPDFEEEEEDEDVELELVYSSEDEETEEEEATDDEIMDPRWEALKNIKKN